MEGIIRSVTVVVRVAAILVLLWGITLSDMAAWGRVVSLVVALLILYSFTGRHRFTIR